MAPPTHFHITEAGNGITFFGSGRPPEDNTLYQQDIVPGVYGVTSHPGLGWILQPQTIKRDGLIDLPESNSAIILGEIDNFFTPEVKARYAKYKFLYRRGILMYGKQGTGKTATVYKVIDKVVAKGGVVFYNVKARYIQPVVQQIHAVNPNTQILVIWEEFERYKEDTEVLQLLDGGKQIDNVVYLATTNYIEKLPPRIKNRPSRFARRVHVGPPSAEARKLFLMNRIHPEDRNEQIVDRIVAQSDGWVVDHLTEVIRSHFVIGQPLDEAMENIRTMNSLEKE